MRVLVGVVGVGMGHATRSEVVIAHLLGAGHVVRVVSYGGALTHLNARFLCHPNFSSVAIEGLGVRYDDEGAVDLVRSVASLVGRAPGRLASNLETWLVRMVDFVADVVVSDFDSWSWMWAQLHGVPVIGIDNLQSLVRFEHPADVVPDRAALQLLRASIRAKLPGRGHHYLVPSFFRPTIVHPRTTRIPPLLRPAITNAQRSPSEHVLVYQSVWSPSWDQAVRSLPIEVRAYGSGRQGSDGNVTWRAFSEAGFVDDLRTARAVIAGGGFSLMSEAVHLGVPMLSIPLRGQTEQEINARWLRRLGYGATSAALDGPTLARFLERVPAFQRALWAREPEDPTVGVRHLEGLLADLAHRPRWRSNSSSSSAPAATLDARRVANTGRRSSP